MVRNAIDSLACIYFWYLCTHTAGEGTAFVPINNVYPGTGVAALEITVSAGCLLQVQRCSCHTHKPSSSSYTQGYNRVYFTVPSQAGSFCTVDFVAPSATVTTISFMSWGESSTAA